MIWLSRLATFFARRCPAVTPAFRAEIKSPTRCLLPPILWLLPFCLVARSSAAPAGRIDYSRDIQPILADKCYACHGPDAKARQAKLRLDTREGAFRSHDGVAVIVPGRSDASELIRRITADVDERMPPPTSNRRLSAAQVELLKRWVDQGAPWGVHWSFVPPRHRGLPAVQRPGWIQNPIDAFVLARLETETLAPAPLAARETLIRRVTLDLTGLPPTATEIETYLADAAPDAYERLLDRLLASPRFGERLASQWLDLARFADTHGYQMDRYRPVWPWRDWVIAAFNRNLPFDQFITWQLAGDLLPQATKEQRLATAFNRLHLQNEEGGIVEEEFRVAYVVDRVNTFGTAFLGLTFECARCHDHKFDPITQRDFYSLFAFFQNIDESGQTSYFTDATPVPALLLADPQTDVKLADLNRQIAVAEEQWAAARTGSGNSLLKHGFQRWLAEKPRPPTCTAPVAAFSFDSLAGNQTPNRFDPAHPGFAHEGPRLVPGRAGNAAELDGENGFTFPGIGHFTRADPFSLSLWVQSKQRAPRMVVLHHSRAPIDAGSRGYELLLEDGRVAFGLHHMWPGNSLKVVTRERIPTGAWTHLAVTYDGSSRASGVRLYLNGVAANLDVVRDGLAKDITYSGGEPDLTLGYRFRDNGFSGGRIDDLCVFDCCLTPLEVADLTGRRDLAAAWTAAPAALTPAQREGLYDYYLARVAPESRRRIGSLQALRHARDQLLNPIPEIMVMRELPIPKLAYVLKRGAYDARGDAVTANTPAALPPFPADQPRNRLGLARWLLAPRQPLTARVTVNRAWQLMFGRGLVETSDNFGNQGTPPTHPELLDWLALDFIDHGWDLKRLFKQIARSATYRQSSRADASLLARDPENRLLARGPARRLTAEMLRDQALAASGLLAERIGGPSVKPYQPEGLWAIAMGHPQYDRSTGNDLYRRSLYTFWKRTVPPPLMVTFDAAERNLCAARRQNTNTPLQALALLNDVQFVEAARCLAERMLREGGRTRRTQVAWAFRTVTGRRPSTAESGILEQLFTEQRSIYLSDPPAAERLLAIGDSKRDPRLSMIDIAAGTMLATALFNHDEALMRR